MGNNTGFSLIVRVIMPLVFAAALLATSSTQFLRSVQFLGSVKPVIADEPPVRKLLDQIEVIEGEPAPTGEKPVDNLVGLKDRVIMQDSVTAPAAHKKTTSNIKSENGALHWKSGDVSLEPGLDPDLVVLQSRATNGVQDKKRFVYVVAQYEWEPTTDQAAKVLGWGYEEIEYIPENAFIVRLPADKLSALAKQPFVRAVAPLRPEWKLHPELRGLMDAAVQGMTFTVRLVAFEPIELGEKSPLARIGESLNYEGKLRPSRVTSYLNHPLIKWIEPAYVDTLSLATSVDVMAVDNVQTIESLDGSGVSVGVVDSGIDSTHAHFSGINMVLERDWVDGDHNPIDDCTPPDGHGTHVAGTVAGSSTFNGQTLTAVAPAATLIIERIFDCNGNSVGGSYADLFNEVTAQGANVISNSWGHDSDEEYDSGGHNVDEWAHDHENVVLVFANGNGCDPYLPNCDDDMISPGLAKNVIAVGAIQDGSPQTPNGEPPTASAAANIDLVSDLNNLDLPEDQRIKPDINAPGEWITSAFPGGDYRTWLGTSMATPHISGLIALYLQQYPDDRVDLVKAALVNAGVDLGVKTGQTTYAQGWGRATAYDFIYKMSGEAVDSVFTGEVGDTWPYPSEQSYEFAVPSGAEFLRVTVTYLDRAGSENANPALVNDLDMRLHSPSGTDYYSQSGRDNVEQIHIDDPEAGTWTLYVYEYSIPGITHISQKYAGNISVVAETPTLSYSVPSSVDATQDTPFGVHIERTASNWFAYGVHTIVESLNSNIRLVTNSRDADVVGDMWAETRTWTPSFVATSCGNFADAIQVTLGATNFSTATKLVSVNVPCDGGGADVDVALIIDSTGSMISNDPSDRRLEAAKIFIDTMQDTDQVAVVDFDCSTLVPWQLTQVDNDRNTIKNAIDSINSDGFTDLGAGLQAGYDELSSSTTDNRKAAVFLTDGQQEGCGTGYQDQHQLYESQGWPVYTVGLGSGVNESLLQQIANETGGKYFKLSDASQLQSVYFEIAAEVSQGDVIFNQSNHMTQGSTWQPTVSGIPAGTTSLSFLVTWPGSEVSTTLVAPNGTVIDPSTVDPNVYHAKGLTYELYRISNPQAGNWRVDIYGANLPPGGEMINLQASTVGNLLGDVSGDGSVNVFDALFILQYGVGLREASNEYPPPDGSLYMPSCDVSGDNNCNVFDALFIQQCGVGISNTFCP